MLITSIKVTIIDAISTELKLLSFIGRSTACYRLRISIAQHMGKSIFYPDLMVVMTIILLFNRDRFGLRVKNSGGGHNWGVVFLLHCTDFFWPPVEVVICG